MINRYTYKVYQSTEKLKNGNTPIFLRVRLNGKKIESKLFDVLPGHFDERSIRVSRKCKDHMKLNMIINSRLQAINDAVLAAENQNVIIKTGEIISVLNGSGSGPVSFFDFITTEIELSKGRVSKEHYRHYLAAKSKLKAFRDSFYLKDVDYSFLIEYENWMLTVRNNSKNTVAKSMAYLKFWLGIALKRGLIDSSPFKDYKLKREKTKRPYLTYDEVKALEAVYESHFSNKVTNVLQWFLFGCYTGLRYADIKLLTWDKIREDMIVVEQQKTGNIVKIPLSGKARLLLPERGKGFVFKMYSNQKCNEYLKIAALAAGIEKNVTFHVSRHTFATISLNLGIRLEVVSELLGHSDLKVTKIYAKLIDETLQNEMKAWDKL